MDIPTVLHIDTGRAWRGGQGQVLLLIQQLQRGGLRQVLACPRSSELFRRCQDVPLIPLASSKLGRTLGSRPLLAAVGQYHPNLIHAHDAGAHSLGLRLKRCRPNLKLVVTRRVIFPPSSFWSRRRKYLSGVDQYIAISRAVAGALRRIGVEEKRIEVIPSGVDFELIDNALKGTIPLTELLGKYQNLVISAGALTPEKDFETAVAAFALAADRIPGAGLLVFGDGPRRAKLEGLIRRCHLDRVHLMGHYEPLAPVYTAAKVFLLCSTSEGLNSSAIEAAACGLPLVVSDVGGLPEVATTGFNGRLCPPGDIKAFADALVAVLTDEPFRARLAANARVKAREFDIRTTAARTLETYQRLLVA